MRNTNKIFSITRKKYIYIHIADLSKLNMVLIGEVVVDVVVVVVVGAVVVIVVAVVGVVVVVVVVVVCLVVVEALEKLLFGYLR